jgi:hypothetical protein
MGIAGISEQEEILLKFRPQCLSLCLMNNLVGKSKKVLRVSCRPFQMVDSELDRPPGHINRNRPVVKRCPGVPNTMKVQERISKSGLQSIHDEDEP